jgi:pantoate--beta-alanine ligase
LSTAPRRPRVLETIAEVREAIGAERAAGRSVSLTPTLGALHDGHLAHLERAAELVDTRVVSIFVNPLQFGPSEDLDKYPRTLDSDLDQLAELGVPLVFAPTAAEMYPAGNPETHVSAGRVGELYEGRSRPGHFDGVLTVVAKLLLIVAPDIVTFGQKDAQQLFLVRRMIRDLNIPVTLEVIDIVRENDGLALSSRNRFLEPKERRAARALSLALEAAASSADRGIDAVVAAAQGTLMGEPLVDLDYLKIVNPNTFLPADDGYRGRALVLVAARVGTTRLIDNEWISLAG